MLEVSRSIEETSEAGLSNLASLGCTMMNHCELFANSVGVGSARVVQNCQGELMERQYGRRHGMGKSRHHHNLEQTRCSQRRQS